MATNIFKQLTLTGMGARGGNGGVYSDTTCVWLRFHLFAVAIAYTHRQMTFCRVINGRTWHQAIEIKSTLCRGLSPSVAAVSPLFAGDTRLSACVRVFE